MSNRKQTKYMMSNGLAFAEGKEMNKLSKLSEEGWMLEGFAPLGFRLRKAEPHKLIYCLDYYQLKPHEHEGYIELFEAAGWRLVCSDGYNHIFAAEPGTKPIYTDRPTAVEKYNRISGIIGKLLLVMTIITLAMIFFSYASAKLWDHPFIRNVSIILLILSVALLVPIIMVYTAYRFRIRKLHSSD